MHTNAQSSNKYPAKFISMESKIANGSETVSISLKVNGQVKNIQFDTSTKIKLEALFAKAHKAEIYNVNFGLIKDGKVEAYRLHFNKYFKSGLTFSDDLTYTFSRIMSLGSNSVVTYKSKPVLGVTKSGALYPCSYIITF